MTKPRILLWDIETFPNLGYIWGHYEQNVLAYEKEWQLCSVAWKWLGEPKIDVISVRTCSEYKIVDRLHHLMEEADFTIAHNGDQFDVKKLNTKFLDFGMIPPEPSQSIDTLKLAKKYFTFNSNKLNDLCQHLGLGKKVDTGGFQLWQDCMKGKEGALKRMEKYNKRDVELLEKLYLKLRPWINNQPRIAINREGFECPSCGSSHCHKAGYKLTISQGKKHKMQCDECGRWFLAKVLK